MSDFEKQMKELAQEHEKALGSMRARLDAQEEAKTVDLAQSKESIEKLQNAIDEIEIKNQKLEAKQTVYENMSQDETPEELAYKGAFYDFVKYGKHIPDDLAPDDAKTAKLISGDAEAGGYLCPIGLERGIQKDVTEMNPLEQYARVTTLDGIATEYPLRSGNLSATWSGEQGEVEKSASTYKSGRIELHGLDVIVPISHKLLQVSQENMEAEIRMDVAEAFADAKGIAQVTGDGVAKPFGLIDADNGVERVTSSASGAISVDDIISLMFEPKSVYAKNSIFGGNRKVLRDIRKKKGSDGHYIMQTSQKGKIQFELFNTPFVELPAMTDTVTANAEVLAYGDFRKGYRVVNHVGSMRVIRDDFTQKANKMVEFMFSILTGGRVNKAEALKILKIKA